MAKSKKGVTIAEAVVNAIFEKEKEPFHIISASIDDDYCSYAIEYLEGIEKGEISNNKKRKLLIHEDLRKAFAKFNVHLAFINDIFKHAGIEITDIDKMHGHDFTFLYTVRGFKMQGKEENEGIILIGTKMVSGSAHIGIESPKIMLDSTSSYLWYNELRVAVDIVRKEVEEYRHGKGIPVETEEPEEKPDRRQGKLFKVEMTTSAVDRSDTLDEDFANAAL